VQTGCVVSTIIDAVRNKPEGIYMLCKVVEVDIYLYLKNRNIDKRRISLIVDVLSFVDSTSANLLYSEKNTYDIKQRKKMINNLSVLIANQSYSNPEIPCSCYTNALVGTTGSGKTFYLLKNVLAATDLCSNQIMHFLWARIGIIMKEPTSLSQVPIDKGFKGLYNRLDLFKGLYNHGMPFHMIFATEGSPNESLIQACRTHLFWKFLADTSNFIELIEKMGALKYKIKKNKKDDSSQDNIQTDMGSYANLYTEFSQEERDAFDLSLSTLITLCKVGTGLDEVNESGIEELNNSKVWAKLKKIKIMIDRLIKLTEAEFPTIEKNDTHEDREEDERDDKFNKQDTVIPFELVRMFSLVHASIAMDSASELLHKASTGSTVARKGIVYANRGDLAHISAVAVSDIPQHAIQPYTVERKDGHVITYIKKDGEVIKLYSETLNNPCEVILIFFVAGDQDTIDSHLELIRGSIDYLFYVKPNSEIATFSRHLPKTNFISYQGSSFTAGN
jgi:hypothetical protein